LFEEVEINYLIVGHTKFSVDRHFGLAKAKLKKYDKIETIE